jgi:hypothetical protein
MRCIKQHAHVVADIALAVDNDKHSDGTMQTPAQRRPSHRRLRFWAARKQRAPRARRSVLPSLSICPLRATASLGCAAPPLGVQVGGS